MRNSAERYRHAHLDARATHGDDDAYAHAYAQHDAATQPNRHADARGDAHKPHHDTKSDALPNSYLDA